MQGRGGETGGQSPRGRKWGQEVNELASVSIQVKITNRREGVRAMAPALFCPESADKAKDSAAHLMETMHQ